ncbi:MAG: hypothetical protein JWN48_1900, partial [Myxococcaceae bacterium]|nr:hypothetical protein [Myxococcaceae bacterium]
EGEIQVMDFIVQTLLRGGSPTMAVRNKDFSSLCRKIQTMKSRVNEKQLADELAPRSDVRSDVKAAPDAMQQAV